MKLISNFGNGFMNAASGMKRFPNALMWFEYQACLLVIFVFFVYLVYITQKI